MAAPFSYPLNPINVRWQIQKGINANGKICIDHRGPNYIDQETERVFARAKLICLANSNIFLSGKVDFV